MLGLLYRDLLTVETLATGAAGSAETSAALGFAGLLVEFANTDFLLNAASLNQFSESANRFLRCFFVSQRQLNHSKTSIRSCRFQGPADKNCHGLP
ncbi:hypothetical protein HG15A2_30800 [Adhaeretor mobilis]|uniref:Uncharacterized protein n=1 Tax=Adhaeretor mobilis TaxID=1930276 RepID=A0A517MXZ8_9BACT|nr:hypothetical protein HG15A2_30800 [Adhaeretor mobilis]